MQRHRDSGYRERGMTLAEALISLLLLSLMMIAFLGLLDSTSRVAKTQNNIADSTENIRFSIAALVRLVRMAGTGGLPLVVADGGGGFQPIALVVEEDNAVGGALYGGRTVRPGTDVLRVRGAIVSDIYDIQGQDVVDFALGTVDVPSLSPFPAGGEQTLQRPSSYRTHPVVLLTMEDTRIVAAGGERRYGGYRVVEVKDEDDAVTWPPTADASGVDWMTINFITGGSYVSLNPNGAFTAPAERLIYGVAFLDDMVFFVSDNDAGDPCLYRSMGGGAAEELVPNIVNLQVSLGCDINRDGTLADSEWFFSGDNPSGPTDDAQLNTMREVRLSVVARSSSPEQRWEDKIVMPENSAQVSGDELKFRYRVVTVRTGLRSHPPMEEPSA